MKLFALSAAALSLAANVAVAETTTPEAEVVEQAVLEEIRGWVMQPVTLISLRAQNAAHAALTQADIQRLDEQWRTEKESTDRPLIAQVLTSPLSTYLTRVKADSLGLYTEVFVIDNRGLNVGQSSITSDYWQGDEDKWQRTFAVGPDAVFVDAIEFDDETQTRRAQVNLSIADPDSGAAIGSVTVEFNVDELERRWNAGIL